MKPSILDEIRRLLRETGVAFQEVEHEPTFTSEESARARGEALSTGAKAIFMKADDTFGIFVLPADRRVDSAAIKRYLGLKKLRFATREELLERTGLVPGSLPPFGIPILPYPLYSDSAVGVEQDRVAFNAGSLTRSIVMAASDWERVANPKRFGFSIETQ